MGTAASSTDTGTAPSFAAAMLSSSTAAILGRNEIAFAQTAAEAAAAVASATAAVSDAAEETRATEEEEEEEADNNEGSASYPTHNWVCSGVDEGEIEGMAADGVIPPSSDSAPTWRSAFGDPVPAPIKDERVLLSSNIVWCFSLPTSAFMLEILNHYGLQLHNITPNSFLYISGFVALFEGYLGLAPRLDFFKYYFGVKRMLGICRRGNNKDY